LTVRALSDSEALRFGRNVLLPEIGLGGQETLRSAQVRVTELGAVGSAAALYLGAAGIGGLVLGDDRPVEAEDLAGTLYRAADVGTPRAEAARRALAALDPDLVLVTAQKPEAAVVEAHDLAEDRCTLSVSGSTVTAAGGPGPQALLAGALAAAEVVKVILGLGAPVRAEVLP
jgi:molybdopterin/thiamine biosynthesis adenylyltransferase